MFFSSRHKKALPSPPKGQGKEALLKDTQDMHTPLIPPFCPQFCMISKTLLIKPFTLPFWLIFVP